LLTESSYYSDDGGIGVKKIRFSFQQFDLENSKCSEREKLRNFEPVIINKNVSEIALTMDTQKYYWQKEKNKSNFEYQSERQNIIIPIGNVMKRKRFLWTK
jgi:hypothetical protein